jgi:hypothetical protein
MKGPHYRNTQVVDPTGNVNIQHSYILLIYVRLEHPSATVQFLWHPSFKKFLSFYSHVKTLHI